jgi:hypothetical protein
MTASELIQKLQAHAPDAQVWVLRKNAGIGDAAVSGVTVNELRSGVTLTLND